MDCEIKVKVKYGWLHSRGHANMYACSKYIDLEIELDLEIIDKHSEQDSWWLLQKCDR